jgi:hypothetical protein
LSLHFESLNINNNQDEKIFNSNDVAFTSIATENKLLNHMWILDSGASFHYCQSFEGLTNIKDIEKSVCCDYENVKYVSEICSNLFSLNKALKNVLS